jgi:hypothetical protein
LSAVEGSRTVSWEDLAFSTSFAFASLPVPLAQDCGELHYSFAKEPGGVVSNFGLPEWVSNLLSPTKVKFN